MVQASVLLVPVLVALELPAPVLPATNTGAKNVVNRALLVLFFWIKKWSVLILRIFATITHLERLIDAKKIPPAQDLVQLRKRMVWPAHWQSNSRMGEMKNRGFY